MLHSISLFPCRKIFLKTLSSGTQIYCEMVDIILTELNMLLKVQKEGDFKTKTLTKGTEPSPYYPKRVNAGFYVRLVSIGKKCWKNVLQKVSAGGGGCLVPGFMLSAFISVVTKQWNTVSVIIQIGTFAVVIHSFACKTII